MTKVQERQNKLVFMAMFSRTYKLLTFWRNLVSKKKLWKTNILIKCCSLCKNIFSLSLFSFLKILRFLRAARLIDERGLYLEFLIKLRSAGSVTCIIADCGICKQSSNIVCYIHFRSNVPGKIMKPFLRTPLL